MISQRILFTFILLIITLSEASALQPSNDTIEVIQLAEWIVRKLPDFNPGFIKNLLQLTPVPVEVLSAFSSAGYVVIYMIIVLLLFVAFIVVSIMQCACGTCSDPKASYGNVQKVTGKVLNTMVLFTMIVVCIVGIIFYANFNSVSNKLVNDVFSELQPYRENLKNIHDEYNLIPTYNVSVNVSIDEIENVTTSLRDIDKFFDGMRNQNVKSLEQVVPIVVFVGIAIVAIVGIIAGFFHLRCVYAFIAILFFFVFLAMLLTGLITGSGSILLSDICVIGVDTQIDTIISNTKLTDCSKDLLKDYIFCDSRNMSCDPIDQSIIDVKKAIKSLDGYDNKTENVNHTIQALESIKHSLELLSSCNASKKFYQQSTELICSDLTSNLIRTSAMMELITFLSFVFFILFYFNWNRFKVFGDYTAGRANRKSSEVNMNTFARSNRYSDTNKGSTRYSFNEADMQTTPSQDLTIGCFIYTIVIMAIWGLLTFGCVVVVSIGSQKVNVLRRSGVL